MATTQPTRAEKASNDEQPKPSAVDELIKFLSSKLFDAETDISEATEVDDSSSDSDEAPEEMEKQEEEDRKVILPFGSVSEVQHTYKSAKDQDGNWTWVNEYPEEVEEPAESAINDTYAVLVRNVKAPDARKQLEAQSLVVQSPWLKEALGDVVLKDYPGVACVSDQLTFKAPFKTFVHRWTKLAEYMGRDDLEAKTREHLVILHDILQHEIGDSIKLYEDYAKNGVISFKHLWMIFQPGLVVLAAHKGPLSAFELVGTEYMKNQCGQFLQLRASCVDFGGKDFGRYTESIRVPEFIGIKKITELAAFPLEFHESKSTVVEALVKRGRVFENLAGHHYKAYHGTAIGRDRQDAEVPIRTSGRIVVDTQSFNSSSTFPPRDIDDWPPKDLDRLQAYTKIHGPSEQGHLRLPPYFLMLTRSRTRGYSLKRKEWLEFFVEQVEEVEWDSDAFGRLVLPEDQKELILAFSESQLEGDTAFDNVIYGKGKGVICLLSGPPGVGKTLTAETVAEKLRVPLLTLSSGDLGSEPWEVENGLSQILELVARWNAVLLLDGCDVFLESRSTHDLERNKVVSILMRTLEYYEGILFITSNRAENIDAALRSRIHVSLEYPKLATESKARIWKDLVGGFKQRAEITDADVNELAKLKLNGRQIKNTLKTALLLASRKKSVLKRSFIDTVLAIETRRPAAETG